MKMKILLFAGAVMVSAFAKAQISFSDASSNLTNNTLKSGVAMAVTDMNGDGLDDIIRLDSSSNLEIEYQQTDGSFTRSDLGPVDGPWAITIADVDENGMNDILVGGFQDGLKLLKADNSGAVFTQEILDGPGIFLQNANFADINNDGSIDFFGCHDDGLSNPYENNGSGTLFYNLDLIDTSSTVASDNSGNYGSIWIDYDNDGDQDFYISKCRQGIDDPMDGRRLNLLFQNDGNNNFTDVAEAAGLRPMTQSWSTNFGDIDNDGDLDAVMINHFTTNQIFENNGDGTFTDITAVSGITSELLEVITGIQVLLEDFDNDGFIDIFLTAATGDHRMFLNDGDKTFTTVSNPFTSDGHRVQSAAAGDLNNDGFIDFIAGYADSFNVPSTTNSDQLFINNGNSNNWSKIILEGVESNLNGIGARVEIYGAWGMQIREVRSGESYGTQNSLITHFGIGDETTIDQIIVRWPSGIVDVIASPDSNTALNLREGDSELSVDDTSLAVFSLYPNPANSSFTIATPSPVEGSLSIYDITGKQVINEDLMALTEQNIDISRLTAGVYFVSLDGQTIKLIKR
ncbi:MAG: hypothetical protein ACJARZ_001125 [Dokdonia sp.]|jgi:hypothetical protein